MAGYPVCNVVDLLVGHLLGPSNPGKTMLLPRAPIGIGKVTPKKVSWLVGLVVDWLLCQLVSELLSWSVGCFNFACLLAC